MKGQEVKAYRPNDTRMIDHQRQLTRVSTMIEDIVRRGDSELVDMWRHIIVWHGKWNLIWCQELSFRING